jgi:hypothetical protein
MRSDARALGAFLALLAALSAPFRLLGAVVDRLLLPGLPVSALAVVCPALAAVIVSRLAGGMVGGSRPLGSSTRRCSASPFSP